MQEDDAISIESINTDTAVHEDDAISIESINTDTAVHVEDATSTEATPVVDTRHDGSTLIREGYLLMRKLWQIQNHST